MVDAMSRAARVVAEAVAARVRIRSNMFCKQKTPPSHDIPCPARASRCGCSHALQPPGSSGLPVNVLLLGPLGGVLGLRKRGADDQDHLARHRPLAHLGPGHHLRGRGVHALTREVEAIVLHSLDGAVHHNEARLPRLGALRKRGLCGGVVAGHSHKVFVIAENDEVRDGSPGGTCRGEGGGQQGLQSRAEKDEKGDQGRHMACARGVVARAPAGVLNILKAPSHTVLGAAPMPIRVVSPSLPATQIGRKAPSDGSRRTEGTVAAGALKTSPSSSSSPSPRSSRRRFCNSSLASSVTAYSIARSMVWRMVVGFLLSPARRWRLNAMASPGWYVKPTLSPRLRSWSLRERASSSASSLPRFFSMM
mmetsp:Transcript_44665/g.142216  ORF Transcript_44665/g.142216 Transcript_44665/m.142216 type:complete len:364 (+) Transcript_44665:99-1190(+)